MSIREPNFPITQTPAEQLQAGQAVQTRLGRLRQSLINVLPTFSLITTGESREEVERVRERLRSLNTQELLQIEEAQRTAAIQGSATGIASLLGNLTPTPISLMGGQVAPAMGGMATAAGNMTIRLFGPAVTEIINAPSLRAPLPGGPVNRPEVGGRAPR